ncbi:MAG: cytochrome C oxidase subunit I [Ferruginibacter sp.]|nr:cytochrome C oxidase subunit I [Ferruginibacter sp.]
MVQTATSTDTFQNTSFKVVLPFYIYGALAFLAGTLLLVLTSDSFTHHYFHPHTLATTHAIALGWGTMLILGASHQLVPVLIEGKLYSVKLAAGCFILAATGIPFLVYAFYVFNTGWPARLGGTLINVSILVFLINIAVSIIKSKKENVQAVFIFTAIVWLLMTTLVGLVLVYNFTYPLLSKESLNYLPLHAHMGIVGWFLLMIIGVGSRLIPLFLISKYTNSTLLWVIYALINAGLLLFMCSFLLFSLESVYFLAGGLVITAIPLLAYFCLKSFQLRIRKKVDAQLKISLLSVLMTVVPVLLFIIVIGASLAGRDSTRIILTYGFTIFFGWITTIILGMTFKTLPFIVWNKLYHHQAADGQMPTPKDLFSNRLFQAMATSYLLGFVLFAGGILLANTLALKSGAIVLLLAAFMYNLNVFKICIHQTLKPCV